MHKVEISLDRAELRDQMSAMRVWLDERRCETAVFNSHQATDGILLTVVLNLAEEAEAFAKRFGGRLARPGVRSLMSKVQSSLFSPGPRR